MASLNLTFDNITNADLLVGDASVVGDWNTFFDLPTNGNSFTSVTISGNTVQLFGGSNINLKDSLFGNSGQELSLLQIVDNTGCIISAGYDVFGDDNGSGCQNLTTVSLPSCTTAGDYCFSYNFSLLNINLPVLTTAGSNCFFDSSFSSLLTTVNLPSLTTAGAQCFSCRQALTTVNLPSLTTAGAQCFVNCYSLNTINIPSCSDLGGTVGDNDVFNGINGNTITLTIPSELMTCNSGNPDGDIQYLQANNTVTINVIDPNALNLVFDSIANADLLVGDSSVVGDWNTFFDLPTYGTSFSAVTISGSTVQLFGGSGIEIKDDLFLSNQNIITVVDISCIIYVGNSSFKYCQSLITADFRSVIEVGDYSFGDSPNINYLYFPELVTAGNDAFYYNNVITSLTSLNFPKLVTIGNYCFSEYYALQSVNLPELTTTTGFGAFSYNQLMTNINLPKLTTAGNNCFADCTSLTTINIPSCTDLGGTVGDNSVFFGIAGNTITLTVPPGLMTCNSGNPDGDIQYLQANNTVTILEPVTPTPTPTPTPTSGAATTPTPTPSSTVPPTPTPSPTYIPYSGIAVNTYYEYTIGMLGDFSGGTAPSGATVPHPIMIGNDGLPYAQMNAVQIGGFGGLNN